MGLFSNKKKPCPICGAPTPRLFPTEVEGMPICGDCKDKIDLPDGALEQMSMEDFRQYLDFYEKNRALRDIFNQSFEFAFSSWDNVIRIDAAQKLFYIRRKDNAMVMEASCLKAFRILEDSTVLFESTPEGLKSYETDTIDRALAVQPEIDRYNIAMDRYEQAKQMNEMIEELEERGNFSNRSSTPYISRPSFDVGTPIDNFFVEMTLEHPYWGGARTYEMGTPSWGVITLSAQTFIRDYEKQLEALHTLAVNFMSFIDPAVPEVHIPLSVPGGAAPVQAAPVTDPVAEIQRYKALLDSGVITEEEFTAKKRQLLGI